MLGPALALLAAPPRRARRSPPIGKKKVGPLVGKQAPAPPPLEPASLTRKEILALAREYRDVDLDEYLSPGERAAAVAWIAALELPEPRPVARVAG